MVPRAEAVFPIDARLNFVNNAKTLIGSGFSNAATA